MYHQYYFGVFDCIGGDVYVYLFFVFVFFEWSVLVVFWFVFLIIISFLLDECGMCFVWGRINCNGMFKYCIVSILFQIFMLWMWYCMRVSGICMILIYIMHLYMIMLTVMLICRDIEYCMSCNFRFVVLFVLSVSVNYTIVKMLIVFASACFLCWFRHFVCWNTVWYVLTWFWLFWLDHQLFCFILYIVLYIRCIMYLYMRCYNESRMLVFVF